MVDGQRALTALKRALSGVPSASGVDFFAAPGVADPKDRQALAMLGRSGPRWTGWPSPDFAAAYGGSTRISDYTWGTLHRLTLDSPLGGPFSAPPAFGRFPAPLPGCPACRWTAGTARSTRPRTTRGPTRRTGSPSAPGRPAATSAC